MIANITYIALMDIKKTYPTCASTGATDEGKTGVCNILVYEK